MYFCPECDNATEFKADSVAYETTYLDQHGNKLDTRRHDTEITGLVECQHCGRPALWKLPHFGTTPLKQES